MNQDIRLLNPLRIVPNSFLITLPTVLHDGVYYRKWVLDESYTMSHSCQCHGDCDCYKTYGKRVNRFVTYYRDVKYDNTDVAFHTTLGFKRKPIRKENHD